MRSKAPRTFSWLLLAAVVAVVAWAFGPRPVMHPFGGLHADAAGCSATGSLTLAGREESKDIEVLVNGEVAGMTNEHGNFYLHEVAPGATTFAADHTGYLGAQAQATCADGGQVTLAPLTLPGGDANDDGKVDMFDLVTVAGSYDTCADDEGFNARADLNASGCADMQDLVLMATSYGTAGPVDWPASSSGGTDGVSYSADIDPILQASCRLCHGDSGGLTVASYDTLMAGGNDGPVVLPGNAEDSPLVKHLEGREEPAMPPGGMTLPTSDIELIRRWIDEGAANN